MGFQENIRRVLRQISGQVGIDPFPASAPPDDGVSLAEVVRSIWDAQQGSAGIPTFPAAALPGNGVSLAEVLRYIAETQLGGAAASVARFAAKQHTSPLTTGNIFTFSGTVLIDPIIGRVTTAIQNQQTTIKLSVQSDSLTALDLGGAVDGDSATVGTLLTTPVDPSDPLELGAKGVAAAATVPIIATCTTNGVIKATYGAASTGAILYLCRWYPLSAGATLTAA